MPLGGAFAVLLFLSLAGLVILWMGVSPRLRSLHVWRWQALHLSFLQAWGLCITFRFAGSNLTSNQLGWAWTVSLLIVVVGIVALLRWLYRVEAEKTGKQCKKE